MTNSFTQVFGGTTIYPADVSYLALALTGNISLEWPLEATAGSSVVARIIDITPSGAYTITMPEATSVSVGQTVLFNNIGPSTVAVNKANGSAILSIGAGEQWQAYLIDNTTPGGTWRTLRYGAATAQAQAAALAGPGLVTDGSQLAQNYEVIDFSVTPYTLTAPDRAKVFIWDGGLGTLNLPSAPAAGDGWFVQVRNAGQGDLTVDPSGSELINAGSTLLLQPGDSAVIVSNGTQWYTIGLGQQAVFAFDYTSIAVTGGTYTLSGSELNRIAYKFTGALASNVTIVVPATVQQYWVNNSTTGPFTLSLQASGSGSSTPVTQSSTSILYCDGTAIVPATTAVTFAGILPVSQGGTGANNAPSARTNLGATGIGSSLFTATSAASARSTISAASSGANSDITSLSGLTTPLSVGQGGTGAATLTANGVVVGNGTSAVQVTAAGTTGQVLVGNTGGAPSWATLTGIGVTSFSGGTTGLTPASPTTGAITLAGTLGVANGGTGTATAFTAGSVVFAGASGVYSQDNANLFWDNTNDRLGIGTATPTGKLDVIGSAYIGSNSNNSFFIDSDASLVTVGAAGRTAFSTSALRFLTSDGSAALERMRITSAGNVGIGTSAPASRLQVSYTSTAPSLSSDAGSGLSLVGSSTLRVNIGSDPSFPFGGWIQASNGSGSSFPLTLNPLGGNIGIGTSNPLGKLHIDGNFIRIDQSGANLAFFGNAADLITGAPAGAGIRFDGTALRIAASSSEIAQFTSSGNFGIGTTSPTSRLHVNSGASTTSAMIESTGAGAFVGLKNSGATAFIGSDSTGAFLVQTPGSGFSTKMFVGSTGDVGIGTTAPISKFEVTGGYITSGTVASTGGAKILAGQWSGAEHLTTFGSEYSSGGPALGYAVWPSSTTFGSFVSAAAPSLDRGAYTISGANHVWYTGATQTVAVGSPVTMTERMRIASTGAVGIGTASPSQLLTVSQNSASSIAALVEQLDGTGASSARFRATHGSGTVGTFEVGSGFAALSTNSAAPLVFLTNNTERMRLTAAGPVLIGLTAAYQVAANATNLQIGDPLTTAGAGISLGATTTNDIAFADNTTGTGQYAGLIRYSHTSDFMALWTASTERMRINSAGNIGVNVTPSAWNSAVRAIEIGNTVGLSRGGNSELDLVWNAFVDSAGQYTYRNNGAASLYQQLSGNHIWFNNPGPGTAGNTFSFVERMRIDSSGFVGIGTSSPQQKFVVSNAGAGGIEIIPTGVIQSFNRSTSQYQALNIDADITVFRTGVTERMRIDSSGNLLVGTTSATYASGGRGVIEVNGSSEAIYGFKTGGTGRGYLYHNGTDLTIVNSEAGVTTFYTNNLERARIESNGNFLVGTTSASETANPGVKIVPEDAGANTPKIRIVTSASTSGSSALSIYSTTAAAYRFYVDNAGTIFATSTTISAISDQRLKENVRDLDAGLETILALKPRRFDWKAGKGKDVRDDMGFIAQEVETVLPELIGGWKAGEGEPDDLKSVKAGDLIPVLVKAIQELTARVAQLEGK